jgi:hypothetical protein
VIELIYTIHLGKDKEVLGRLKVTKQELKLVYADGGEANFSRMDEVIDLVQRWRELGTKVSIKSE